MNTSEAAAIEQHRNVDGDLFIGIAHEAVQAIFQTQHFCGDLEARRRRLVNVQFIVRSEIGHCEGRWSSADPASIRTALRPRKAGKIPVVG